jgi:excisionase family DNA binding protein
MYEHSKRMLGSGSLGGPPSGRQISCNHLLRKKESVARCLPVNESRVYSSIFTGAFVARNRTFSTVEAAKEIGISKPTLLRWIRDKKIADVKRDRNKWRVFSDADIERIKKVASND